MAYKIEEIEGIGPAIAAKLAKAEIKTVEKLLEKGASASGRKNIAETCGMDAGKVLDLVNMADLMRINGVGGEFAELLKAAGVDTVKELRTRNAANLHAKMSEVNEAKKLTRRVPSESQLQGFIDGAAGLTPMVTH